MIAFTGDTQEGGSKWKLDLYRFILHVMVWEEVQAE